MKGRILLLATLLSQTPQLLLAQHSAGPTQHNTGPIIITATLKGERPTSREAIVMDVRCDDQGNVYSRPFDPDKPIEQFSAPIQVVTSEAKPSKSIPANGRFFPAKGKLYVLSQNVNSELVVKELADDGSVRAQTELHLGSYVAVQHFAVFNSGEYLVVGFAGTITATKPHLRTPLTAVFAADGHLIKKIYEPEDEDARQHAEGSDPKYFRCCSDSDNEFVGWNADVTAGTDGNVYLLHGAYPQLVYVISPAGEVLRKFQVDSGNPELTSNSIKFYDNRLAIGFDWPGETPESLIKVVDLNGSSIADYKVKEGPKDSSPILACYNSAGFTLMPRGVGHSPHLFTGKIP